MSHRRASLLLVVALAFVPAQAAAHDSEIALDPARSTYDLQDRVEYLEDASGELVLDQLRAGIRADSWRTIDEPVPNFGFTSSAYWTRLQLVNDHDQRIDVALAFPYPLLDRIELFVEQRDGSFDKLVMGDHLPFDARPVPHTQLAVTLSVPPGQARWIYARIVNTGSMQIGMTLQSYEGFVGSSTSTQLVHGLYYGIMLVMALYNLFLFLAIRSWAYLHYVVFVVIFTGTQLALDGVAARYFFPDSPGVANLFVPLIVGLAQLPAITFAQSFLDSRNHVPRLHKLLNGYLAVAGVGVALALFAPYPISIRYVSVTAIVSAALSLVVGVAVLRTGYRPARFFVLAWSALAVGTILYILMVVGVLPTNALTLNVQRIGFVVEVTLLSFALGDRIKILEHEREQARAETLALDRDLALTGAVQQLFLPHTDVVRDDDLELAGFYQPATRCGGDWWFHERRPDGSLLVLQGDVTGHGPAAAMLTGTVATSYRNLAADYGDDPGELMRRLDSSFREVAGSDREMALLAALIDSDGKRVRLWSAGAPPPLLAHADGQVTPLLAPGALIGSRALTIGEREEPLEPGARLFVYTDGLPELVKDNGRQLGYAGVRRLLMAQRELPLTEARAAIAAELETLRAGRPQDDDYCFVLVEVSGADQAATRAS